MSTQEYDVAALAEKVESLENEVAELREEKEELKQELQAEKKHVEALNRQLKTMKTGLTELQVQELQAGSMLSTDGVQEYRIQDELGIELQYCGEEQQYVRASDPEDVGDEKAMAASLPDAAEMCQVEQLRQVYRRGLMDLEELGDAETQRAILVWDNVDTLAEEAGDKQNRNWRISSEKVRRIIKKHHDVQDGSLYELARRVMQRLPALTDGALTKEKQNGNLTLVGKKERIQDELKPLYEGATMDDGSNVVVRR